MGDGSKIEWTDASWNPVTGCSHVSEGCEHCYAETATRQKAAAGLWDAPDLPWTPENAEKNVILHPDRLDQPERWRKPRMIFVNSMSDLFHPRIPTEFLVQVFNVMANCPQHTFQVLTKRPKRMRDFIGGAADCEHGWLTHNGDNPTSYNGTGHVLNVSLGWPLPNVWLGTSIESREHIGRADLVRETPAARRFISAEPLLGPLFETGGGDQAEPGTWREGLDLTDIDWLIVGGESGNGHRPMEEWWATDLRDACQEEGVAFFFKQWGGRTAKEGGDVLAGRKWQEMPKPVTLAAEEPPQGTLV